VAVSSSGHVHSDVESAIERVLAAEAAAGVAVQASLAEAQTRLESARASARRIAERAGERLQRLTLKIDAAGHRDVEALERDLPAVARISAEDAERVRRLVDTIAAELTGAPP
jgi:hypothetical protein